MRVSKIKFGGKGVETLQKIIVAFATAFPSLTGVEEVAADLIAISAFGPDADRKARVRWTIENASGEGEWAAEVRIEEIKISSVYRVREFFERTVIIRPYSSACDEKPTRVLRLSAILAPGKSTGGPNDCQWTAIADYSGRPSAKVAAPVLDLVRMEGMTEQQDGTLIATTTATCTIPGVITWSVVPATRKHA